MPATGNFIWMSPGICVFQTGEVPIIVLFWSVFWTFSDAVPVIIHGEGISRNAQ